MFLFGDSKAGSVVEDLKCEVEFPDIRQLVNSGKLDLKDVLKIRAKSGKFREWLQQETDRDRNAIIAYHNETARELSIKTAGRRAIGLFGVAGGGSIGSVIGASVADRSAGLLVPQLAA